MKRNTLPGAPQAKRTGSSDLYATATQEPYLRTRCLSCWSSLRSYSVRPIMVRGGGMRGKDELTRIEAFGLPSSTEMTRAAKRYRKNRGMPPPAMFDIDMLPASSNLTALEAAAMLQQRDTQGGHPRARKADAVLKRTCGPGAAKQSQIKNLGFAKGARRRKASGPIITWKGS
jgi:hypothetical protein